jgi:hypothetical protein
MVESQMNGSGRDLIGELSSRLRGGTEKYSQHIWFPRRRFEPNYPNNMRPAFRCFVWLTRSFWGLRSKESTGDSRLSLVHSSNKAKNLKSTTFLYLLLFRLVLKLS